MKNIFSNFKIKNLELKNRIVMPPMCMYNTNKEGVVNDFYVNHYITRAMGGVGTIIVEATAVTPNGVLTEKDLGIWSDDHIEGLRRIVRGCKSYGTAMGIQLGHGGRKSTYSGEIVAPSSIRFDETYKIPKELTKEEIKEVVKSFGEGARRAKEAGFDFVEIHGAHGYLLNEFLSPLTNKREDEYGGSIENRARILREVIEEVRKYYDISCPLFVRISAKDYVEGGNGEKDLADILNNVKDLGVDVVDVSTGAVVNARINTFNGYQISSAEIIRKSTEIPVIAGGLITSLDMANEIIMNDRADLVFLGRLLLRSPYTPLSWANELGEECIIPECYKRGF
ncbi:NADPH dehydrogenase NamA [Clostridium sp.]|uniref:NADPH dehydrogenase NamA n=1 Tax=Clostridium sp. TaxID=1506 RepID=UPI0032170211